MGTLTKEMYKMYDKLNKRLKVWDKNNVSSEAVRRVRNDLLNFYTKNDIEIKGDSLNFVKRQTLNEEQQKELMTIAKSMDFQKSSSIAYYKKNPETDKRGSMSFETVRNNPEYGVNNFQDYIKFIDDIKNAKATKSIMRNLDSKQVARLYGYGKEKDLTTEEVNTIIMQNLDGYRKGERLYNFLMDEIDKFFEDNEEWYITTNLKHPNPYYIR